MSFGSMRELFRNAPLEICLKIPDCDGTLGIAREGGADTTGRRQRLIASERPLTIIGIMSICASEGVAAMESPESSVEVSVKPRPQKRPRWRLRVLVVLAALALTLFVISRLEPEQAKKCGPIIESVYLVFNPPIEIELTEAGKQFIAEMATMGGTASRIAPDRRFLGVFGTRERFMVNFSGEISTTRSSTGWRAITLIALRHCT